MTGKSGYYWLCCGSDDPVHHREGCETQIGVSKHCKWVESPFTAPEGLVDPKSYYQGYDDGIQSQLVLDPRPIAWMKDCGGFTDDPILAKQDGFDIPVYISKEKYKQIKQKKPDIVLYVDISLGIQSGAVSCTQLPCPSKGLLQLTFCPETGELKSAEVLK